MLYVGGQGLSAFAFGIVVLVLLAQTPPLDKVITQHHMHDLGKFLFAFLMLWAYLSFSHFLIIWSANLPEEIPWYQQSFREAIKLDQGFADAYNYLGYMFAEEGKDLDEAIVLIKKAIEIDKDNGAYIDSLGWAYFQKGMIDEALIEIERAAALVPNDPSIKDHLGDIYYKKGLIDKARQEWTKSIELDPKQEKVREKLKRSNP